MRNSNIVEFMQIMLLKIENYKQIDTKRGLCDISSVVYFDGDWQLFMDDKIDYLIKNKAKQMGIYKKIHGYFFGHPLTDRQSIKDWYAPRIKVLNEIIKDHENS